MHHLDITVMASFEDNKCTVLITALTYLVLYQSRSPKQFLKQFISSYSYSFAYVFKIIVEDSK